MYNHRKRLERVEKQLCVNKPPVIFEYTDENGVEQRTEMSSDEFVRMLRGIDGGKGVLPCME